MIDSPALRFGSLLCGLLWVGLVGFTQAEERRVVGYVPTWIDLPAFTETLPFEKLTHLNLAFANPENSKGDLPFPKAGAGLVSKAKAKGVKVLISLGGGSASGDKVLKERYAHLLGDAERRAAFVRLLASYVSKHDLDGVDVDLEGDLIDNHYGRFISELGAVLKPAGKLLTAALSKGYGGHRVPVSTFEHFDFINIMAYDDTGPWSPEDARQHSSLAYAKENVAWWLERGLPRNKAVLGVPFYGWGFGKAARKQDYHYRALIAQYPEAAEKDEVGETIWHNSLPTIRAKARYCLDEKLGGIMIWSLDQDASGEKSLLKALDEVMGGE